MDSRWSKARQAAGGLLGLTLLLLCPAPALAHKLYVFAQVEGNAIQGRAYFPGDVPAQESQITARDPSGRELGRTTTDAEGKFTFTIDEHVDYCLTAETPDGHAATYVVHAEELPDSLPRNLATADSGAQTASPATDQSAAPTAAAEKESEPVTVDVRLTELRKQIQELRRQIEKSDEQFRFRDFLGGIGYILGLAGVAFYMKARRRRT
jgi:nickel transport protein